MNKKFLSAILFGALMVTSTGTFVSCKDYDDDIEGLQSQIDQNASSMKSELSAMQASLDGCKTTCSTDLANAKAELAKAIADGDTAAIEKAQAEVDKAKEALDAVEKAIDDVEDMIADLEASVDSKIEALQKEFETLKAKVNAIVGKRLTSLVFKPTFYYAGIEAMWVPTIQYTAQEVATIDANGEYGKDAPTPKGLVEVSNKLVAQYHVNPTSVTKDDIKSVALLTEDMQYETRAIEDKIDTKVVDYKVENGILTVTAQIKDGSIKMETTEDVSVLAAQATLADGGIVTSDYAVVRSKVTNGLNLALVNTDETHLFDSAEEAIKSEHQLLVVWNGTLDLAKEIHTHMGAECDDLDKTADDGIAAGYGFEYRYELVGYHLGDNKTSESAHAALNGSVLRPQITADGVQQPYGTTEDSQNRATIGRAPLVRVILYDKLSGKVAEVGYVKVKIADEEEVATDEVKAIVDFDDFSDEFTLDCQKGDFEFKLKWHDVEEEIIAQLDMTKEEFEEEYTFDGATLNGKLYENAAQWSSTYETAVEVASVGQVDKTATDQADTETEVLKWTVAANDAYQIFKSGATNIKVIVRFTKENTNQSHNYVYVTFNWAPSPLNIEPAGEILDDDKIDEYWYAHNSAEAGFADIHANVEVVGTKDADCEFVTDMLNTFVNNEVKVANIAEVYKDFQNAKLTTTFVFDSKQDYTPVTGVSGEVYNLWVDDDVYLMATSQSTTEAQIIAEIEGSNIKLMEGNEYTFVKDILNYADHNQLGEKESLTAKIAINAKNCEPVALTNNTFFVKFLRPVSISDPGETNFEDAETSGSSANLVLAFTDWREHNFDDETVTKGEDYYTYYGIESIKADEEGITTTLNGGKLGETLLSDVTKKIEFEFTEPTGTISKDNMGVLKYTNNESTVKYFEIQVPLTVTYKWGEIKTHVVCKIGKTIEN